jgi:hypothetical protein
MGGSFVSYFCVSTDKQSRSGLGIEAQRAPLASYLAGFGAAPLASSSRSRVASEMVVQSWGER